MATTEVTVRHTQGSDGIKDYASGKAGFLTSEFPRVEHVRVILDQERHVFKAEVFVQGRNHIRVEAEHRDANVRVAVDTAFEKVERQLRRLRDKVQDHKPAMKHVETARRRAGED